MENYSLERRGSNHGERPPHCLLSCLFTAKINPCASTLQRKHTHTQPLAELSGSNFSPGLVIRFELRADDYREGNDENGYANQRQNGKEIVTPDSYLDSATNFSYKSDTRQSSRLCYDESYSL